MSDASSAIDPAGLDIARLRLESGDVLVVKCKWGVSGESRPRIEASFKEKLPEGVAVLVIDETIDLSILSRADGERLVSRAV